MVHFAYFTLADKINQRRVNIVKELRIWNVWNINIYILYIFIYHVFFCYHTFSLALSFMSIYLSHTGTHTHTRGLVMYVGKYVYIIIYIPQYAIFTPDKSAPNIPQHYITGLLAVDMYIWLQGPSLHISFYPLSSLSTVSTFSLI